MTQRDLGYLLALIRFPKFGPIRLAKMRGFFDSMEAAFCAEKSQLLEAEIEPYVVENFLSIRNKLSPEKELELLKQSEATAVPFTDPEYPPLLKKIYDPPAVLFVRGQLPPPENLSLAVVGSRKITDYGVRIINSIVEPIAASGVVIVSGLAFGVDELAHQAALKVGSTTIAVLGSGVDDENIFPAGNRELAKKIIESGGAVVSEFPIGSAPLKQNFPIRNRIIAGLAHGTLIVEATKTSGSLITARAALESGREVFAVPGQINFESSEGTNQLLKTGAHVVTEAGDVLSVLGLTARADASPNLRAVSPTKITKVPIIPGSPEEAEILKLLGAEPIHADDLARATGKKISEISHLLTLMEMKGSARHVGGLYYTIG